MGMRMTHPIHRVMAFEVLGDHSLLSRASWRKHEERGNECSRGHDEQKEGSVNTVKDAVISGKELRKSLGV
jgi:hypothetical protein